MQFKRQSQLEEGINLTPLIDVVFLLLIFFMVSTTFTKETHLTIELPEANSAVAAIEAKGIDIVINNNGDYSVNGQLLVNNQADTLMRALQAITSGEQETPVVIIADANASHRSVVTAMDVVGRLGLSKLRITTQQPTMTVE